jgi:hypothetical protein
MAAAAVGVSHAAAADIEGYAPDYSGYTLSLEGGALFAESVDADKLGSGGIFSGASLDLNLDNDIGYYAGIRLGRRINENWDVTLGAAVSRFLKNGTDDFLTFSGGGGSGGSGTALVEGSLKSDLDYTTLDFEVGYRPNGLADHDVRLFLGLRGLSAHDSLDKTGFFGFSGGGSGGFLSFENKSSSEFLGIGPRAGASFAHRFDDSSLGLSGMVAGAAIFGRREFDKTGDFNISSGFSGGGLGIILGEADSENDTVYNLEGALGLDFYLGDSSKLTVGARAQKWWNIRGADLGSGGSDEDQLSVGPFLLLEANF